MPICVRSETGTLEQPVPGELERLLFDDCVGRCVMWYSGVMRR